MRRTHDGWLSDTLILTVLFGLLFFIFLGSRPLFTPDEGRYAEIAREMAVNGDYITPYLNSIKYFEKPVLFYWLGALAIKLFGTSISTVRCVNALLALLGCLLTYATGRKLYGRTAGLLASLILGTSTLYFVMAHMVSLDLPVTVFISACLYSFMLATRAENDQACRRYLWGAAIAAALAVLTKGLIGIVFPAMIVFTWMAIMNEWRQLMRLPILSAFLIFLLIAVPWHVLVNYYNPEFFHFYFIEQHFLRYTSPEIGHYQPAWYFIPTFIAGFFPWIVFLPQTLRASLPPSIARRKEYGSELFLLIAAVLIFVFFSFSKSKLIPYILPVIPPLAILTGRYLALRWQKTSNGLLLGYATFVILSGILTGFLWNLSITMLAPAHAMPLLRASLIALCTGSLLALFNVSRSPRTAFALMLAGTTLFLILSQASMRFVDTRTIRPLAVTLKTLVKPGDEVITYNQYYQDLPFYLERRITILNWRNELSFGMDHQDTSEFMISTPTFWKRWHSRNRVYLLMSKSEYQIFHQHYPREKIVLISETPTNVLVTNKPLVVSPT